MPKRSLLLGSLWFAASCSLYDEHLLPVHELWSSSDRDAAAENSEDLDDLKPRAPSLTFDAGVAAADSGSVVDRAGHEAPGEDNNAASGSGGAQAAGGTSGAYAEANGGRGGAGGEAAAADSGGAGSAGTAGAGGVSGAGSGGTAAAGSGGAGAGGSAGKAAGGSGGTGGSAANPNCPESGGQTWSSNGHCYFPLTAQNSWNVSRDNCSQKNAKLVSITSLEEQSFVAGLVGSTPSWIGLSRFGAAQFSWSTGEALSYTNWASGEPNLSGEAAVALRNDTKTWFDDVVSANHPAICERP